MISKSGKPILEPVANEGVNVRQNNFNRPESRPRPDIVTIGNVMAYDYSAQQQQQRQQQDNTGNEDTGNSNTGNGSNDLNIDFFHDVFKVSIITSLTFKCIRNSNAFQYHSFIL